MGAEIGRVLPLAPPNRDEAAAAHLAMAYFARSFKCYARHTQLKSCAPQTKTQTTTTRCSKSVVFGRRAKRTLKGATGYCARRFHLTAATAAADEPHTHTRSPLQLLKERANEEERERESRRPQVRLNFQLERHGRILTVPSSEYFEFIETDSNVNCRFFVDALGDAHTYGKVPSSSLS